MDQFHGMATAKTIGSKEGQGIGIASGLGFSPFEPKGSSGASTSKPGGRRITAFGLWYGRGTAARKQMRFRTMDCQAIVSQNSIELPTLAYTIVAAGVKTFGSLFRCERRMEAWAGIEIGCCLGNNTLPR